MHIADVLSTSFGGVTTNKLRTFLSTLGIIIGVASVISVLALGNGARAKVERQFRSLGSDEVNIEVRLKMDDGEMVPFGKPLTYSDGLGMTDSAALVDRVDMAVAGNVKVRRNRLLLEGNLKGDMPHLLENWAAAKELAPVNFNEEDAISGEDYLAFGRFFTPFEAASGAPVCVLASGVGEFLFLSDDPIGQAVWINRRSFEVIGVLRTMEYTDPKRNLRKDPNKEMIIIPISSAINLLFHEAPSVSITAHVADESRIDEAKAQIDRYLRKRHGISPGAEEDYWMMTKEDLLGAQREAARTFSVLLTSLAFVSLFVGGVGIMNVMLVSVTERTREIGVRKSMGARRMEIVSQFLIEALLVCLTGGIFGTLFGILFIPIVARLNIGVALFAPGSIPLAMVFAIMVGLIFGIYPSVRASRLDPIEALRHE